MNFEKMITILKINYNTDFGIIVKIPGFHDYSNPHYPKLNSDFLEPHSLKIRIQRSNSKFD